MTIKWNELANKHLVGRTIVKVKWLSPRLSSMFQEKQKIDVKSDSSIRISWEDNSDNLIDVSAEDVSSSNDK